VKVLHIVTEDCYGAGRAAIRISEALSNDIESKVVVLRKKGNTSTSVIPYSSLNKFIKRVTQKINEEYVKSLNPTELFHIEKYGVSIEELLSEEKPDILHFHYLNDGIYSDNLLKVLSKKKIPIVWTLHDMWPFTGGCHYDNYCGKYLYSCRECPQLGNKKNITKERIEKKAELYKACNIQFVGCSSWITEQFNNSYIGKKQNNRCIAIPNPIEDFLNTDIRNNQNNKKVILFGAVNATKDKRKGFEYLEKALKKLDSSKYKIKYFGANEKLNNRFEMESESLGYISDDSKLKKIYADADVFVAPSIQENLANTVLEALSSGTPVVAFDIGGMSDMIVDGVNGFLATAFDEDSLAQCIEKCVGLDVLSYDIVDSVKVKFSKKIVAEKYLSVYKTIINN